MATDTLQAMTAAISPSGLTNYLQHFVTTTYASQLNGRSVPDDTFTSPWISFGMVSIENYKVELRNGVISGATAQFNSVTSEGGGKFTIVLTVAAKVNFGSWEETGTTIYSPPEGLPSSQDFDHRLSNFSFSISGLQLTFTVTVAPSGGTWSFTINQVSQSSFDVSNVNIPQGSAIRSGDDWFSKLFSCITDAIQDKVRSHLHSESFTSAAQAAMSADLQTIPNSGQLTPNITYEYHPQTMTFPDNGLAFGSNGAVKFKQKDGTVVSYPGPVPPPLALPPVDPAKHINFYVHQYDFDALFWAFFNDGDLTMKVTRGMLVDGEPLETDTYQGTPLHALYDKYPDHDMTMMIAALTAPTVVFGQTYMITDDGFKQIEATKQVPQDVLDKLELMKNIVFPDEKAFLDKMSQYIGVDNVKLYRDVILKYSVVMAAVVTYEFQYDINVIDNAQEVRVMRIKVDEYDFLENLTLAARGTTQTVTFQFKAGTTTAVTLVETTLPDIKPCDPNDLFGCVFHQIWLQVLKPKISEVLASVGKTGVPLPFIRGFLFVDDVVTLESTYARIDTNIKYA